MKYDKKQGRDSLREGALCGFAAAFILWKIHGFEFLMRRFLIALCVVLGFGTTNLSYAALTINSVTLNGTTSVVVEPGATISATVSETNTDGSRWRSTRFLTNPAAISSCINTGNNNNNGTFSETFNVTAPMAEGTYDAVFVAYNSSNSCSGEASLPFTLPNAIRVGTAPTVTSISRAGINPTGATSVQWTVVFSKNVTGVASGNFALVKTGLGGTPTITSVIGSGTTWTVTATTGTGSGTLGLNMTSASGVTDSVGNTVTGLPATGQVYNIDPVAPSECFVDDFNRTDGLPGPDWSVGSESGAFGSPRIVGGRLRLTDASQSVSTYATLQRIFPGAGNKIVIEFNHYAYGGNGADGMAVVLSDASQNPVAGAFGGSMGYAQKQVSAGGDTTHAGFSGGWLGVALDEYGNFSSNTEGRTGGSAPGSRADSVSIRGSGSGYTGYAYLAGTGTLSPQIDAASSNTPAPGYRYRITIDHVDGVRAMTSVERNTGSGYATLIAPFDAKAQSGQIAVPTNWSLSFTGSTGGNSNIHDFTQLQVCSITQQRLHHIQLVHPSNACGGAPVTVKACANADCSKLYVGKVTVNLSNIASSGTSSWSSGNPLTFFNGQTQVTLSQGTQSNATVNIGGSTAISPPATNATTCFDGATQTSCVVNFVSACSFDAVEAGKAPATPIYTKLAGTPFVLDVRPLNSSGAATSYTGPITVSLVNPSASSGNCTDTNAGLNAEAAITFAGESLKQASFTYGAQAQKNVRVRMIAGGQPSCSKDNFAIRPAQFTLSTAPGLNPATNSFPAGDSFSVTTTPIPTAMGYAGTPLLDLSKMTDHNATVLTSPPLTGSFATALNTGLATGTFQYADVGTLTFGTDAVFDDNFTAVDQISGTVNGVVHDAGGDCNATSASNVRVGDKYGCRIGSVATTKGRFRPHHYVVTTAFSAACNATPSSQSFTYMDQPMLGITLKAQAMSSNNIQLARYTSVASGTQYPPVAALNVEGDNSGVLFNPLNDRLTPDLPAFKWTGGAYTVSGNYSFDRLANPDGSFENFVLRTQITDPDAVNITLNNGTIVNASEVTSLPTRILFGRLLLENANGSELMNLSMRMRTEYWKSGIGFVTNTGDSCTKVTPDNSQLKNQLGGIVAGTVSSIPTSITFAGGKAAIVLKKPTASTGKGSIDLCIDLDNATPRDNSCQAISHANMPWLQGKWNGAAYDDDPVARATFGVFKSGPIIYLRENY